MASLADLEEFLNIEIGDKKLCNGKKYKNKNQYYYFRDEFYIVKLSREKWMILEDCKKSRRLLRLYCWSVSNYGYGATVYEDTIKTWHQLFLNYEKDMVADHINNKTFDNRSENLRIVTQRQNMRNLSKRSNNTSGKQGVNRYLCKGKNHYWVARICNNEGKRIVKQFSIDKLGEEEAKRLAIEKRLEWEQEFGYLGD
jgi:hypothetical protein